MKKHLTKAVVEISPDHNELSITTKYTNQEPSKAKEEIEKAVKEVKKEKPNKANNLNQKNNKKTNNPSNNNREE